MRVVKPDEAQKFAQAFMESYVAMCECGSQEDVGNALMKLVSVAGLGMCAVVGQAEAVARLEATAAHIAKPQFSKPWTKESLQ